MDTIKKVAAFFTAAVMIILNLNMPEVSAATDAETSSESDQIYTSEKKYTSYNADTWEVFASRTEEEITERYSDALYVSESYDNADPSTWYSEMPSLTYPYSAGMINEGTVETMLAMTNYYRWLMGVEPMTTNTSLIPDLQQGALIRYFSYAHLPHQIDNSQKPEGMDDDMWEYGVNVNHNILTRGVNPQDAIKSWFNEGYIYDEPENNTDFVEAPHWDIDRFINHRYIVSRMEQQEITYGYCGNVAIGEAKTGKNVLTDESIPFAAFPAPGYMPSSLVDPLSCAWSVELNPEKLKTFEDNAEGVTVTITNKNTGKVYLRTADDDNLRYKNGCLFFAQPDDFKQNGINKSWCYEDDYQVRMAGIYEVESGTPVTLSYTVNFFNMEIERRTRVTSTETYRIYDISTDMINEEDLKYVASILPDEVDVHADNGYSYSVPVNGKWIADIENSCFVNSAEEYRLPSTVSDPKSLMKEIKIPFKVKDDGHEKNDTLDITNSLDVETNNVYTGDEVNFKTFLYTSNANAAELFRIIDLPNGDCVGIKIFEDLTATAGSPPSIYTIESAKPSDSGKYISVYYIQGWIETHNPTKIYVSRSIPELTVSNPCTCTTTAIDPTITTTTTVTTTASSTSSSVSIQTSPAVFGDMNADGLITLIDVLYLNKYVAGTITISDNQKALADVCSDGTINSSDASVLLQYTIEAITSIPVIP